MVSSSCNDLVVLVYSFTSYIGSTPVLIPNMVPIEPVGAIVNNCEFLNPYVCINFLVCSVIPPLFMKLEFSIYSSLYFANEPFFPANIADCCNPVLTNSFPITFMRFIHLWLPYGILNFTSASANPIIPRPICLQSLTVSL